MSNQSLKLISRLRTTTSLRAPLASRSLHLSSQTHASKPAHEPSQTQGHATKKSHETLHKDADFQSASVRAGQQAKGSAQNASGSADNEPFDAASQGSTGGQTKPGAGKGPFKDQNGGQDVPGKGPGVKGGKQEVAAGGSIRETLSNSFESLKQMRKDGKNFSTSARVSDGTTPRADAKGSREPKDTSVKGDQNAHLKHTEGGSQGGKKQGNASPDPSLPSKNKKTTSAGSSSTPSRSFSTSLRAMADPNAPGMGGPGPAEKEAQKNAGIKQQPRGSDTQHGGSAGGPTTASSGSAPESSPNPTTGTAAPNPEIPSSQKGGKTQAGMGVRKFSTSARALADPNAPGVGSPGPAEKEAQKNAGIKQQPRGSDVEHGGAAGGPTTAKSGGAPESAPNPTSGTAAPNPEIPGSQKGGATRDGMGVRKFSTTARRAATTPPGGYAKAVPHEASEAGYNAPPTALPGNLKSAYEEHDPNAIKRTTGEKASSNLPHSSTAVDPPNEALRQKVLSGEMHEMNRQPDGEIGKMGNEEAWKHRK